MIYTHAMQESIIHHIAAANSFSAHPVYHHLSEVMSNVWRKYTTKCLSNTKLRTQSIGLMSDLLDVEKVPKVENSLVLTYKKCICVLTIFVC